MSGSEWLRIAFSYSKIRSKIKIKKETHKRSRILDALSYARLKYESQDYVMRRDMSVIRYA